jgi:hypothetical protein
MKANQRRRLLLAPIPVSLFAYGMLPLQVIAQPGPITALATSQPVPQPLSLTKGPYLQALRPDGLTICVETSQATDGRIVVQDADGQKAAEKSFRAFAGRIAHVAIDGLKPNAPYQYAVYLADATEPAYASTFKTFPPAGHLPVEFAVTGDSRTYASIWHDVSEAIRKTGVPMVLHSGDIVVTGRVASLWNAQFFDPARAMLASVALYPAVGNHELAGTGPDGYSVFGGFFVLPENKIWYSFDYGGVHILVLDSNRNDTRDSEQYRWVRADLAASKATWKVAMFHHPWFDAGMHEGDVPMRRLYGPLFVEGGVDLIVVGHDHNYQKTKPMIQVFEPASKKPIWQIVSAGGGAPLYPIRGPEVFLDKGIMINHYLKVTADKDRMVAVAYDLGGKEIDRLEIRKGAPIEGAITFEQIEIEQMLHDWLAGKPFVFAPAESAARLSGHWTNTLPVPVKLRFEAGNPRQFELTSTPADVQVPAQVADKPGSTQIRLVLRRIDPNLDLHDLTVRLIASYDAAQAGSGKVTDILVPVVALQVLQPTPASQITVDGKLDEPAWSRGRIASGFRDANRKVPESPAMATAVQTARDERNLYLAVTCRLPEGWVDNIDADIAKADHVQIDLAAEPGKVVTLIATPTGRTQTKPAGGKAKIAVARSQTGWTVEAAVPLAEVGGSGPVRCNVLRRTDGKLFSLVPYGNPFNYETAAIIPAIAANSQPAVAR